MTPIIELKHWHIIITLFIALCLSAIPLPKDFLQPEWVLLVVIYWAMYSPSHVGFALAWFFGLLQDLLLGTVMGQYSIIYVLIYLILGSFHLRIRIYPLWKQSLLALTFILFTKIVLMVEYWFLYNKFSGHDVWLSLISSFIIWYLVLSLMDLLFKRVENAQMML